MEICATLFGHTSRQISLYVAVVSGFLDADFYRLNFNHLVNTTPFRHRHRLRLRLRLHRLH
jgi:hypothetical protein